MAKLDAKPIAAEDLERYLEGIDDFQFELKIFRACQGPRMQALHGGTYKDPVTGLNRQFDIRVFVLEDTSMLRLAIECKATRANCPLLVSRIPRQPEESKHFALVSYKGYVHPQATIHAIDSYFRQGKLVGKATAQVGKVTDKNEFTSADGELYGKWSQAIASAHDLVRLAQQDFRYSQKQDVAATTVLPILVISDGTLWVADHNEDGIRVGQPHQVDECSLYLAADIPFSAEGREHNYPVTHLLIFTETGFREFAQKISSDGYFRNTLCVHRQDVISIAQSKFGSIS